MQGGYFLPEKLLCKWFNHYTYTGTLQRTETQVGNTPGGACNIQFLSKVKGNFRKLVGKFEYYDAAWTLSSVTVDQLARPIYVLGLTFESTAMQDGWRLTFSSSHVLTSEATPACVFFAAPCPLSVRSPSSLLPRMRRLPLPCRIRSPRWPAAARPALRRIAPAPRAVLIKRRTGSATAARQRWRSSPATAAAVSLSMDRATSSS